MSAGSVSQREWVCEGCGAAGIATGQGRSPKWCSECNPRKPPADGDVAIPDFTRIRNGVEHVVPGYTRKRPNPRWTDEAILAAMRKWAEMYDDNPHTADWNPALARQQGTPQRQVRYLSGIWPSSATVMRHFGTWSNAIRVAGLEPNMSGPRSDMVADPKKLSRRNLVRLRGLQHETRRVGPAELTEKVKAVVEAERTGEPELLQDALLSLAAVAVAWSERVDR